MSYGTIECQHWATGPGDIEALQQLAQQLKHELENRILQSMIHVSGSDLNWSSVEELQQLVVLSGRLVLKTGRHHDTWFFDGVPLVRFGKPVATWFRDFSPNEKVVRIQSAWEEL